MYYLQVKELSHKYHTRTIIDGVDFSIQQWQKIALVARNGSGKSTFLHLLMNRLECTHGEIMRNKSCRVWFLEQQSTIPQETVIWPWLHDHNTDYLEYKQREYDVRLDKITRELKIRELFDHERGMLSWGEQKRVALAKILIDEPDVLVLDEPTNHLDLEMITRLEEYLTKPSLTLLMVTHDRYFLERVCNEIIELDRWKLYTYSGNYSDYLYKKSERMQKEHKDMHNLKQLYRRELAWVKKAPRARESKSVKRTKDFFELQDQFKTNQTVYKEINKKIEIASAEKSEERMLWNKIIQLTKVCKSFAVDRDFSTSSKWQKTVSTKKILSDFSHEFRYGERIGILGKNGVGKSTFLNILVGEVEIDTGRRDVAENVQFWYYSQQIVFPPHVKVLEYAKSIADWMMIGKDKISATKLLERFLFSPAQQQSRVHDLSGWEKRRLYLLTTLMKKPNFLILDEPTNDLDIETMNALEDFLLSYTWCLVVISHDRYFMDKIADRIFSFEWDGKVEDFQGTYSMYIGYKQKATSSKQKVASNKQQTEEKILMHEVGGEESIIPPKATLTYNEKKEFDSLMRQIAKWEERKHEINVLFQNPDISLEDIKKLWKELAILSDELEAKEMRRFELSVKS